MCSKKNVNKVVGIGSKKTNLRQISSLSGKSRKKG